MTARTTRTSHAVFGAGKVRHIVDDSERDEGTGTGTGAGTGTGTGDRVSTLCRMFYNHQADKVRLVDPDDERSNGLPVCGACLRTPKAKLLYGSHE